MPIIFHSTKKMTLTQILLKPLSHIHTHKIFVSDIFFLHLFFCAEKAQKNMRYPQI